MNKIIFCLLPFLLTCSSNDKSTYPQSDESKCEYRYFLNSEGKKDSVVVSCPDLKPPDVLKEKRE